MTEKDKLATDLQRIIELLQARYEQENICAAVMLPGERKALEAGS